MYRLMNEKTQSQYNVFHSMQISFAKGIQFFKVRFLPHIFALNVGLR